MIVRHARTVENAAHLCQGQTDGTLAPQGVRQAILLGKRLRAEGTLPDAFYCSDLGRAVHTYTLIAEHAAFPPPVLDKRLRERYFGSMEGHPFPQEMDYDHLPPEVEPVEAIYARIAAFISELCTRHDGQTVLLLSHGFTIRVLVGWLKGLPVQRVWEIPNVENTSLCLFRGLDRAWEELRFNDFTHLQGLQ